MFPFRFATAFRLAILLCLASSQAFAGSPPPAAQAARTLLSTLATWDGPRQLLLRTDRTDPGGDPAVQRLLARFLEAGYQVRLGTRDAGVEAGLIADLRVGAAGDVIALSTATGAVLVIEPVTGANAPLPATAPPTPRPDAKEPVWPTGPVRLATPPRRIAVLDAEGDTLQLAALLDDGVLQLQLSPAGTRLGGRYPAGNPPTRGLYLGAADLDGDGRREVAASWAEDVTDLYTGTNSRLHGQILRLSATGWEPLQPDLGAHLRVTGTRVYRQARSPYRPFAGLITPALPPEAGGPVAWAHRDLFAFTPVGDGRGLAWDEHGRLQLVDENSGALRPGGLLLDDLGPVRGPTLAVRLEEPEYRSGLERNDRVTERHVPLPPRVETAGPALIYTILRGRKEGLPLVGRPQGSDQVVRIRIVGESLRLEHPFPAVDAFILDFALVPRGGEPATAVVLLNDRGDGEGDGYLLVQVEP